MLVSATQGTGYQTALLLVLNSIFRTGTSLQTNAGANNEIQDFHGRSMARPAS
jgi:hypothetical protein